MQKLACLKRSCDSGRSWNFFLCIRVYKKVTQTDVYATFFLGLTLALMLRIVWRT